MVYRTFQAQVWLQLEVRRNEGGLAFHPLYAKRNRHEEGEGYKRDKLGRVYSTIRDDVDFGCFKVDLNNLKKGFFAILYSNKHLVPGYPKIAITNNFRQVIKQLIGNQSLDTSNLTTEEVTYLNKLIKRCKFKNVKYDSGETNADLLKKLTIITGIINTGNDSRELLNELSLLLNQMVQNGAIKAERAAILTKEYIANV